MKPINNPHAPTYADDFPEEAARAACAAGTGKPRRRGEERGAAGAGGTPEVSPGGSRAVCAALPARRRAVGPRGGARLLRGERKPARTGCSFIATVNRIFLAKGKKKTKTKKPPPKT